MSLSLKTLSGRKTAVLETLRSTGLSMTVSELASQLHGMTPASAFGAVKALSSDGLIEEGGKSLAGAVTWRVKQ